MYTHHIYLHNIIPRREKAKPKTDTETKEGYAGNGSIIFSHRNVVSGVEGKEKLKS